MAETPATPTETYSEITGKTEVAPEAFLTGEEGHVDEPVEDTPTGDTPVVETEDDPEKDPEIPNNGDDPEAGKKDPKSEDPKIPEEKTYAGKYKTLDDLKAAFVELGGDPDDYQDPKMLEEAYKVRQSEFTRARQNNPVKTTDDPVVTETPANVEEMVEQIFSETSEKVASFKNASELYKFTLQTVLSKVLPMIKPVNAEELAKQVIPQITKSTEERSRKEAELRDVETEVPRLRTDKKFRDAFAFHVGGLMRNGSYTNLKDAMKGFVQLTTGKSIDDQEKKNNLKDKGSAQPLPDTPTNSNRKETDEVDEIVGAYGKHKEIFG